MFHDARPTPAPVIGTCAAAALFAPFLAGLAAERLCVAHLDENLRLLHLAICPPGTDRSVHVPLRAILRDALALEAHALVLAHNHPHGDPRPSDADRRATRRIAEVARVLDLHLLDHLVFAGTAVTSFRALSLL